MADTRPDDREDFETWLLRQGLYERYMAAMRDRSLSAAPAIVRSTIEHCYSACPDEPTAPRVIDALLVLAEKQSAELVRLTERNVPAIIAIR